MMNTRTLLIVVCVAILTVLSLGVTAANPQFSVDSTSMELGADTNYDAASGSDVRSLNPDVARVDESATQIISQGVGEAIIRATKDGTVQEERIRVTEPEQDDILIDVPTVTAGQKEQINVTLLYRNGETDSLNDSRDITWSVGNQSVATVNNFNELEGHNAGATTVTANVSGRFYQGEVTVTRSFNSSDGDTETTDFSAYGSDQENPEVTFYNSPYSLYIRNQSEFQLDRDTDNAYVHLRRTQDEPWTRESVDDFEESDSLNTTRWNAGGPLSPKVAGPDEQNNPFPTNALYLRDTSVELEDDSLKPQPGGTTEFEFSYRGNYGDPVHAKFGSSSSNWYAFVYDMENNEIRIEDNNGNTLDSQTVWGNQGDIYDVTVDWGTNGDFEVAFTDGPTTNYLYGDGNAPTSGGFFELESTGGIKWYVDNITTTTPEDDVGLEVDSTPVLECPLGTDRGDTCTDNISLSSGGSSHTANIDPGQLPGTVEYIISDRQKITGWESGSINSDRWTKEQQFGGTPKVEDGPGPMSTDALVIHGDYTGTYEDAELVHEDATRVPRRGDSVSFDIALNRTADSFFFINVGEGPDTYRGIRLTTPDKNDQSGKDGLEIRDETNSRIAGADFDIQTGVIYTVTIDWSNDFTVTVEGGGVKKTASTSDSITEDGWMNIRARSAYGKAAYWFIDNITTQEPTRDPVVTINGTTVASHQGDLRDGPQTVPVNTQLDNESYTWDVAVSGSQRVNWTYTGQVDTYQGYETDQSTASVAEPYIDNLTLEAPGNINENESQTVNAYITWSNGTTKELGDDAVYSSSNQSIIELQGIRTLNTTATPGVSTIRVEYSPEGNDTVLNDTQQVTVGAELGDVTGPRTLFRALGAGFGFLWVLGAMMFGIATAYTGRNVSLFTDGWMCDLSGFAVMFLVLVLGAVFGILGWVMVGITGLIGFIYLAWLGDQQGI